MNKFHHLEGLLSIRHLGNRRNESDTSNLDLQSKTKISDLRLDFSGPNSVNNEAILAALQPPPNLQGLMISNYRGSWVLPSWTVQTNLKALHLFGWDECEQLPSLENLSSLEVLMIGGMNSVKRVGVEVFGLDRRTSSSSSQSVTACPNLKSLRLRGMKSWEEWDCGIEYHNVKVMPSLHFLEVDGCSKLKELPEQILQIDSLQVLVIRGCPILSEQYRKGTGDLWSSISHIPNIQIDSHDVQVGGL